jgi:hypothetical protein
MDNIRQISPKEAFLASYWKRLKECRGLGQKDSMKQLFDAMVTEYSLSCGQAPFPSFNAFRMFFYRHPCK